MSTKTKLTVKRAVKMPYLKLEEGQEYDVKFDSPMQEVPARGKFDADSMTVCNVVLIETGELLQIIVPAVLKQHLIDEGEYVGRYYRIVVGEISNGNNWRDMFLYELDAPVDDKKGA